MNTVARTALGLVIRDHVDRPLIWRQVNALERIFELRTFEEEVIGTLRWDKELRSSAVAECSRGAWTFQRYGLLKPRVDVRVLDSHSDVAVLRMNWKGGGALQISGGRKYHWSNASLWDSSWAFSTDSGDLLLRISTRLARARPHAELRVEPGAASVRDLDLLVLLSGYLQALITEDLAAVLEAAVTASGAEDES